MYIRFFARLKTARQGENIVSDACSASVLLCKFSGFVLHELITKGEVSRES